VDEAGRGPLAGPVVAAAVILDPARPIRGLADSKILLPAVRERLSERIRIRALAWSIAWADREEIDALNILQATMLAMRRALLGLRVSPDEVQIDGNRCPSLDGLDLRCGVLPVVKGDASVPAISAASILAKTFRDARMRALDGLYPQYGFAAHKGYCTRAHLTAAG
jgi:ribonuclease HII